MNSTSVNYQDWEPVVFTKKPKEIIKKEIFKFFCVVLASVDHNMIKIHVVKSPQYSPHFNHFRSRTKNRHYFHNITPVFKFLID